MMGIHDFWMFAFASLMLNITPGNDMLFVIGRSTTLGAKAGVAAATGILGGSLIHTLAAVVGLSAILARSAVIFDLIKYAGAAYLVYLGLKSLMNRTRAAFLKPDRGQSQSYRKIFVQGLLTNVLNPKVAIFFLAFLPQFIDPANSHAQRQILFLGIWFDCSGTLVNLLVAVLFARMGQWMSHTPQLARIQEKITGVLLISIGIKVALTSKK